MDARGLGGTLNLALENESGIKPLVQRAGDLGYSFAWGVDERLPLHEDNPLMQFLWNLTQDARDESEALHERWLSNRDEMFRKRNERALPDVFAAPVSFAAYLGLDMDRSKNREWRKEVREKVRTLVATQRAKGVEDAASTAEMYLSTPRGLHSISQSYRHITRLRTGESLRSRYHTRRGRYRKSGDAFWHNVRAAGDPLSTTYWGAGRFIVKEGEDEEYLRNHLSKWGVRMHNCTMEEILTVSGNFRQRVEELRHETRGAARWSYLERNILAGIESTIADGEARYLAWLAFRVPA